MRVFHGSKKDFDKPLEPRFIAGSNGCQDGIGINLTDSMSIAMRYAGEGGYVYVSELNVDNFLRISDDARLNGQQVTKMNELFSGLSETIKTRMATDFFGKKSHVFGNKDDAEEFYTSKYKELKHIGLYLDRMKPEVDEFVEGNYVILAARTDFDFVNLSTKRMHYCLNLLDNYFATEVLKSISSGLILENEGSNNYLSFRFQENVLRKIPGSDFEKYLEINNKEEEFCFE